MVLAAGCESCWKWSLDIRLLDVVLELGTFVELDSFVVPINSLSHRIRDSCMVTELPCFHILNPFLLLPELQPVRPKITIHTLEHRPNSPGSTRQYPRLSFVHLEKTVPDHAAGTAPCQEQRRRPHTAVSGVFGILRTNSTVSCRNLNGECQFSLMGAVVPFVALPV